MVGPLDRMFLVEYNVLLAFSRNTKSRIQMNVTQVEYPYSRLEILVKREKKRNQCHICKQFELIHQTHLFRLILTRIIQSLYYALLFSSSSDSADRGRSIIRVRLIWDIWAHEASFNPPLFIEVSISRKVSGHVFVC